MEKYITLESLAKYPFLPQAREYVKTFGIKVEQLADSGYIKILIRAKERIEESITRAIVSYRKEDEETELLSFPIALIIVASMKDGFIQRRFALAEAERCEALLKEEDLRTLIAIGKECFGLNVKPNDPSNSIPYEVRIHVTDYLKEAVKFNASEWKLVNRLVHMGFVYVTKNELARLMKNAIEGYINQRIKEASGIKLPEGLNPIVKELKERLSAKKPVSLAVPTRFSPDIWPPCMREIYDKLKNGESVSHFANFSIASFLINIGVSLDKIVSIYAERADFDEKIAKYQVEHIAGLRGSKTKYTTPSCKTMLTHGLCIENGKYCGNVTNPLQYYRRKVGKKRELEKSS